MSIIATIKSLATIYNNEKKATKAIQSFSDKETAELIADVRKRFPDDTNTALLSETMNYKRKTEQGVIQHES